MNLGSLYLFVGPETGEKNREVRRLREVFTRDRGGQIDYQVAYGFDDDFAEVVGSTRNGSLFSNGTFLVFRSIEEMRGADDLAALEAFAKNPPNGTVLVLESNEVSTSKSAFMKKAAALVPKPAQKVFWEMYESQRQTWLVSYIRENGGRIST